jgi:hypothetical protein
MLCEHLEGKPLAEVNAFTPRDMLALVGLPLSPRRLGCALLAYEALRLLEPFASPTSLPRSSPSECLGGEWNNVSNLGGGGVKGWRREGTALHKQGTSSEGWGAAQTPLLDAPGGFRPLPQ